MPFNAKILLFIEVIPAGKVIPIPEKIPLKNRFFYQVLSHVKVRFAGPEKDRF